MGTIYWMGIADAVAQIAAGSIDSVDATPSNNTFTVTIGGVTVSVAGDTDVATTAAALVTALNASTHPYFAAITWSGNLTATADTAGVPFTATLTVSGAGTGSVTNFSDSTACSGPNHWDTAANWSGGAVPVAADDVIIQDNAVNICWGLAQSAVDLDSLTIKQTYTGKIGLDSTQFATTSNGETFSSTTKPEYRAHYLDIESDAVDIGEHFGPGAPAGSGRIKLDLGVHLCVVNIHNTARVPTETGLPCVRLLVDKNTTDIYVRKAPGGLGIAAEEGDETSTIRELIMGLSTATEAYVHTGSGVTLTTWTQAGGRGWQEAAATVTTITLDGGELYTEGGHAVTTANVNGGTLYSNSTGTITTLNLNGGVLDMTLSGESRTVTNFNWDKDAGATFALDPDDITLTNGIVLV